MKSRTALVDSSPETGAVVDGRSESAGWVRQTAEQEVIRPNFRIHTGWLLVASLSVLAIVSTLAGCGGSAEIESLLSSGPTVFDTEAHSVKIVAVSSLPIVCVVAYGTNTDYGLTSTDTDMEGGGHTDHHHVLLGLKPDTEYHFRFSAIGPRGEGYRSKDYTFRTPPG